MKKLSALMITAAFVGFASAGYAADDSTTTQGSVDYKKNGGYDASRSSEQTLPDGSKKTSETTINKDVDSNGLATKKVTTETKVTPPGTVNGLLNQKKDVSTSEVKEKDRGGSDRTDTQKHTDPNGTNVTVKTSVNKDVDKNGNVTETVKSQQTVDPQGLMNAKTTETKTKTVNGAVVEESKQAPQQ